MKATAAIVALVGVAGLAASASVAGLETLTQVKVYFVGEDASGIIVARELTGGELDHAAQCLAQAPRQITCGTGTHTRTSTTGAIGQGFIVGCRTVPNPQIMCFVGRMNNVLSDGVNTRTYYCDVLAGPDVYPSPFIRCGLQGTLPRETTTFTHTCSASGYLATPTLAAGDWGCNVSHD